MAVLKARPSVRPKVILESWDVRCNTWAHGPTEKGSVTRWSELGYTTRIKFVRCVDVGGAVNQFRLFVARVISADIDKWNWPKYEELSQPRPMSNLLTPSGLIPSRAYFESPTEIFADPSSDPMPPRIGATIKTDRGFRRIKPDEFCRGLGFTKHDAAKMNSRVASRTTSLFHWEYLSPIFSGTPTTEPSSSSPVLAESIPVIDLITSENDDPVPSFDFAWRPPDLSEGGDWYNTRLSNLRRACQNYPNSEELFDEGLSLLKIHRNNYDEDGPNPTFLQLLW